MKVFVVILFFMPFCFAKNYRKDGSFIIGAVLPISQYENGKCSDKADSKGVAVTEAIVKAISSIGDDPEFSGNDATKAIGYDIRDSCGNPDIAKSEVYNMNMEKLIYQLDKTKQKPADIIISSFTTNEVNLLNLLNIEKTPQMSYDAENARLYKTDMIRDHVVGELISMFPENTGKLEAIVDLIKKNAYEHVYSVASDNYQGRLGVEKLSSTLSRKSICKSEDLFVKNKEDIKSVLQVIQNNPLIKVVVIQLSKEMEIEFYKEANSNGLTDILYLSTQDWFNILDELKPHASVVDGMLFVETVQENEGFKTYLKNLASPYTNKPWLEQLYETVNKDESKVKEELLKYNSIAGYALDGVYAIAHVLKDKSNDTRLVDGFNGLKFLNQMNGANIEFTDHLTTISSKFGIYNVHGGKGDELKSTYLGQWNRMMLPPFLRIDSSLLVFKDGSKEKPISVCSDPCQMGFQRLYASDQCCWVCETCPNGTISNVTNANKCITCPANYVANPEKTQCVRYTLDKFQFMTFQGGFLVFLVACGVCLALFGFGIVSQNSEHEIVKLSGHKSLCCYILGCLILFLSPIPLLIGPTVTTCSAYIALINIGMTLPLAVIISRSNVVNGYYDAEGNVIKDSCYSSPRGFAIAICLLVQLLIMIIGLALDPPLIMHNLTPQWNVRYFECSSWASYVFWIGFGYNIALSIIGNFINCTATKMEENYEELKYIIITLCCFYLCGLTEICIFYRANDEELAAGQGYMCVIFGLCFFICFVWPKLFIILFRSKEDHKTVNKEALLHDHEHDHDVHMTTAIHASAGYRGRGVVQMKIKEDSYEETET